MSRRISALAGCVIMLFSVVPSWAGDLSWTFQRTGFRSTYSAPYQTALSMRGGLAWPVVYGLDLNRLQVISLFSVPNPNTSIGTNWHSIGSNIVISPGSFSSGLALQAASSLHGGFGVSAQWPPSFFPPDVAVVGNSAGLSSVLSDVNAIDFDSDGNLFTVNHSTIPDLQENEEVYEVALSPLGDVGIVTQENFSSAPVKFWQESPLLGGWFSTEVNPEGQFLSGQSVDLLYDSIGRPHVLGVEQPGSPNEVLAYTFDIISASWEWTSIDASTGPPIADVTAATDGNGTIGAAWVNNGVLKYASLDTNQINPTWDVSTVTSETPLGHPLEAVQSVGLAFDRNGLPVISFVDDVNAQIWIAYDPPINVPEPGTMVLLSGVLLSGLRTRFCR